MRYRVLILSEDTVFSRMLELEFAMLNLSTRALSSWEAGMEADVVLIDLDSLPPPPGGSYGCLIGFTRAFSVQDTDPERLCSLILHRPFEVRLLREEVLALMPSMGSTSDTDRKRDRRTLQLNGKLLSYGEVTAELSTAEASVVTLLLERRGTPVSREEIAAVIGEGESNKTDVYVCYLRRKIQKMTDRALIRTIRKKGYQID